MHGAPGPVCRYSLRQLRGPLCGRFRLEYLQSRQMKTNSTVEINATLLTALHSFCSCLQVFAVGRCAARDIVELGRNSLISTWAAGVQISPAALVLRKESVSHRAFCAANNTAATVASD